MLSKGEAAALLSLINAHHGNAQWDDVQLDAFHSELRSDITAAEAREAVRRFYADNSTGRLPPAKPKRRREGGGFNPGLGVALDEVLATRRPAES